jgi:hypothetical protein
LLVLPHNSSWCALLLKKAHLAPSCQRKMCDSTYHAITSQLEEQLNKEARSSHISRESDKVLQLAHRC